MKKAGVVRGHQPFSCAKEKKRRKVRKKDLVRSSHSYSLTNYDSFVAGKVPKIIRNKKNR